MLPRGLFFDPYRNRYRVRFYKDRKVIYLSYHKSKEEALQTYKQVKQILSARVNTKALQELVE